MAEQLVFYQAAEALRNALGAHLNERAKARFREIGLDYSRRLEPAYPLEMWRRVVNHAGELIAPGLPYDQQQLALGSRFITAFTETIVGRATLTLMRLLGPRRTLERMAKTLRVGNNYSETRLTMLAPNVYELWCNHVQNPSFYRGMLHTGLEHTGMTGVEVTTMAVDRHPDAVSDPKEPEAAFRISWTGAAR